MNRRNFAISTAIYGTGLMVPFKNNLGKLSDDASWGRIIGFLIPVIIDKGIDYLFDYFDKSSDAEKLINQSIEIINNTYNTTYKYYYDNMILPNKGKSNLNGKGFRQDLPLLRNRMNDANKRATTPVHSVRDVKHFKRDTWSYYCDNANLQVDDDGGVFVNPTDNRPSNYKGVFYVSKKHAYFLYNPSYYCVGLPIENPQYVSVTESLGRNIRQKTGKIPRVSSFYTQKYFYQGDNDCQNGGGNTRKIYWDYGNDAAINEYYGLSSIQACGDPSDYCGDGSNKVVNRGRRN